MSQLPTPSENYQVIPLPSQGRFDGPPPGDLPLAEMWGIVRRHLFLIAAASFLTTAVTVAYVLHATPVYEGVTSLRIEEKQPNLPEVFRMSGGGEVLTEVEVLRSRSLVEDATRRLKLQVALVKPKGVSRQDLLGDLSVGENAVPGKYELSRMSNGRFTLVGPTGIPARAGVAPGDSVRTGGLAFVLSRAAGRYSQIELRMDSLDQVVAYVQGAVSVGQGRLGSRVVSLRYRNTDPQLVWQVPNAIAESYIARRQDAQKTAARSTAGFLRKQLDTLSRQLAASERELRQFREREQVVNPQIEGSSQVDRLIRTQAERSQLEGERAALADLLTQVERSARRSQGEPSPYRRLLAFPTLLRTESASDLLRNLTDVEDRRAQLLVRRLPADPEVQALDTRAREIENQLRSVATTYLQGLTNQVRSVDTAIQAFGRQLSGIPRRELEFARLQRQPKILEEMYALLQTRLKEAEIAQAVEDPSVQIVDPAVPPLQPVSPRKRLSVTISLFFGLVLGVGLSFLREYLDKAVHTRTDVTVATGLPVLGLIPRIPRAGRRMALIGRRREIPSEKRRHSPSPSPISPAPAPGDPLKASGSGYTFLATAGKSDHTKPASAAEPSAANAAPTQYPRQGRTVREISSRIERIEITNIGTAIAEAYGSLQTNLIYSRVDEPVRSVVFTSAQPGEGKTTTVVNLALSLTHRGAKVLLIDADLRRGTVHSVFGVPREPGFSDLVRGVIRFEDSCRSVQVDEGGVLHYLTSGNLPPNPSAMLASHELKLLLESLRDQYEMIIIDSPPVNMLTDAALLGSNADGVVIVARAGSTHSAALGYALEQLGHVRARLLGVVLNDIDFKRDATYDAAYRYHDYSQYTANSPDR